ncbi:GSCFA domain-containing protein [Anditalea andensis]|uniref:GSCFA domain-containing protein n=1 Tax=Anditalea andensis TaxID=1048983 RepID=A0A074KUR1_9BACT|nr:GSCFA domain-containing protein [Anditalea andensis]KEO72609.1 hypothetical protein EL17_17885 [Anditalea andensis]
MNLRTTFNIPPSLNQISHHSKIMAMGSCFATMLGKRLEDRKYDVLINPFGTIFNPVSLFTLLEDTIRRTSPNIDRSIFYQDRYLHYNYHSSLSAATQGELISDLENIHLSTNSYLKKISHLFITLGTAYAYQHNYTEQLVANCHKQPAALFTKRLLSLEEMKLSFESLYHHLIDINPEINIIFTVSPVRHTKDGIPDNHLSKSLLRVLAALLVEQSENVHYFPSYELMMDDLRDYRFYKEDLIHPTEQAENYIYARFADTYISDKYKELDEKILKLRKSIEHKPFNSKSAAHQKFLNKLLINIKEMPDYLNFDAELAKIKKQIREA